MLRVYCHVVESFLSRRGMKSTVLEVATAHILVVDRFLPMIASIPYNGMYITTLSTPWYRIIHSSVASYNRHEVYDLPFSYLSPLFRHRCPAPSGGYPCTRRIRPTCPDAKCRLHLEDRNDSDSYMVSSSG